MKKLIIPLVLLLTLLTDCGAKQDNTADTGEAPAHIYLNENYYVLDSQVSVIPDTFSCLGEVSFCAVGQAEMEGNVRGSIYASSESPHLIYLLPADLEDPDAPEYWIFLLNDTWEAIR